MNVAILGWGSLLWDNQPKHAWFNETIGNWEPGGPTLPLEFCRISSSRKRALTLILQPAPIGSPCRVSYALSNRSDLADVIADLRKREGSDSIGLCAAGDSAKATGLFPDVVATIQAWLDEVEPKIDAVIWTDLENNFAGKSDRKKPFSIAEALIHLKGLPPHGRALAAEYIWRAPKFVQTKLRRAVEAWPCPAKRRAKTKGADKRRRPNTSKSSGKRSL